MDQYNNKTNPVAAMTSNNVVGQNKLSTETRIKQLEDLLRTQHAINEKYRRELNRLKNHIDNIQRVINKDG